MRMMKRLLLASTLAGSMLMPGAGIAGKADDTLNIVFPRQIDTIDYMYSTRRENTMLSLLVDEALVYVDEAGQTVPLLAESFEFTDPQTLDMVLRQDVKFHDGSSFGADDVVYTAQFLLNEASKNNHRATIAHWMDSVEKTGEHSVRIHLSKPYSHALYDLAYRFNIRKAGIYDDAAAEGGLNLSAQNETLIGLGPYRVVQFVPGQSAVLELFDGYRADSPKGAPAISRITMRTIPEVGTQTAELMSGTADWAYEVPADIAQDIAGTGRATHLTGPSMRLGFLVLDAGGVNDPNGPIANRLVREAMYRSINREEIRSTLVGEDALVINAFCSNMQFGCKQDVATYDYDPARAKELLAEAGYANGVSFELWGTRERPILEAIINQWGQVGINAELRFVNNSTQAKARLTDEIKAYYTTWGSYSLPDTGAIVPVYFEAGSNRNWTADAELAAWAEQAMTTNDPAVREEAFHKALDRIAEEIYVLPLFEFVNDYVVSNELDFKPSADGMERFFTARWK